MLDIFVLLCFFMPSFVKRVLIFAANLKPQMFAGARATPTWREPFGPNP